MQLDELYPSRWIKSDDLAQGDLALTIREVTIEQIGLEQEDSPILWFNETEKGLPMNVTNARAIGELHGSETNLWAGSRITLYRTEVEFQGKTTFGVRVRLTAPAVVDEAVGELAAEAVNSAPPAVEGPDPVDPGTDDTDVPF